MIEHLEKNPIIEYAQPDYYSPMVPCNAPTDPGYNASGDNKWGQLKISAPKAWDIITTGSQAVKIGVLDTGINDHEDFYNGTSCNLVSGKCFIS